MCTCGLLLHDVICHYCFQLSFRNNFGIIVFIFFLLGSLLAGSDFMFFLSPGTVIKCAFHFCKCREHGVLLAAPEYLHAVSALTL